MNSSIVKVVLRSRGHIHGLHKLTSETIDVFMRLSIITAGEMYLARLSWFALLNPLPESQLGRFISTPGSALLKCVNLTSIDLYAVALQVTVPLYKRCCMFTFT